MSGVDVLVVMDDDRIAVDEMAATAETEVGMDSWERQLERHDEARAAVAQLLKSAVEIKFDLYELTTPELQAAFDGQTRIAVVQIDSLTAFRAALAAITTTPESN